MRRAFCTIEYGLNKSGKQQMQQRCREALLCAAWPMGPDLGSDAPRRLNESDTAFWKSLTF